jgi:hypothetical protein
MLAHKPGIFFSVAATIDRRIGPHLATRWPPADPRDHPVSQVVVK